MGSPQVPGKADGSITLPCGEDARIDAFDMGMREYACPCGAHHAVVMDVHPLGRWVPESIGAVLESVVEPADAYETFGTVHLMGMMLEEFPDAVAVHDASENPTVGWALLWVTEMDARRLHAVVVELLVELMDHAVGHAEDEELERSFADQLASFDVEAFVDAYRDERSFEDVHDRPT